MHDTHLARSTRKAPHRVRIRLRDGRVIEGSVFLTERDFLAPFLSSRKRCVSITEAEWSGMGGEPLGHMVLPLAMIVWVELPEGGVGLAQVAPAAQPRGAQIQLQDGVDLRVTLKLLPDQRLSDWFDAADAFLPVSDAHLLPRDHAIGDIALARDAVSMLRELA